MEQKYDPDKQEAAANYVISLQNDGLADHRKGLAILQQEAARYRFLRERFDSADFAYGSPPRYIWAFEMDNSFQVSANLDKSIDDALLKLKE